MKSTAEECFNKWNKKKENGPGLHLICMEFQRDEMENNFKIDRNFGSKYLGMIPMHSPDDIELNNIASEFILNAMVLYINTLKVRKESLAVKALRKTGKLSVTFLNEFFEGCNALMALPETKLKLREEYLLTSKAPGETIIAMQREVLTWLGVDSDFGVSCLNNISKDFGDNR